MRFKDFLKDERGSVFIFVGLSILVLIGVIGIALDLGTQGMIRTRMQNAADAGALAGAIPTDATPAEREAIARRYFALNYPDNYQQTDLTAQNVGITVNGDAVQVDTQTRSRKADILPVLGRKTIETRAVSEVSTTSTASRMDMVMVMDKSDSMNSNDVGGTRIAAAYEAAEIVIDEVLRLPARTSSRLGWVDYTTERLCLSVKRGIHCTNEIAQSPFTGDANTISGLNSSYRAFVRGGKAGATNGADALEMAENIMRSANASSVKAVIYMTDGLNNMLHGNYTATGTVNAAAENICTRMKKEGVVIFTVALGPAACNPSATPVLRNCATSAEHFFCTTTRDGLKETFRNIVYMARSIRISK